ncbi:MAG: hypothetical protein GY835_25500 [bacterium]|nr:hypothetical protein [bacterium]
MTAPESRDSLRRQMGEASALPPDDPLRREVENRITGDDAWAEPEWLAQLQEAEGLRLELARTAPSERLTQRLLAIPDENRVRIVPVPGRTWLAAAAILIFLFAVWQGWRIDRQHRLHGRVETLAMLALDDHLNDRLLTDATVDHVELCDALGEQLGFEVQMPIVDRGFTLRGGRTDKWGGTRIAFSLWEKGGQIFTLSQFRTTDYDLPAHLSRELFCCPEPGIDSIPTDIIVWATDEAGYVLVGPHSEVNEFELTANEMQAAVAADHDMAMYDKQTEQKRGEI